MTHLGKLAIVMLAGCMVGCFTMPKYIPPSHPTVANTFTLDASFETVWTAVIETFADLNIPIDNLEKASGLITTDWLSMKEYGDCGAFQGGLAGPDPKRVPAEEGKFNVFVKSEGEKVTMKINSIFRRQTASSTRFECASTGLLEQRMEELIRSKVFGRAS